MFLTLNLCVSFGIRDMAWLFSEAGHGKAAHYGVGSAIKRAGDKHVAQGGKITKNSDLVALIHSQMSQILIKEVYLTDLKTKEHLCIRHFALFVTFLGIFFGN